MLIFPLVVTLTNETIYKKEVEELLLWVALFDWWEEVYHPNY